MPDDRRHQPLRRDANDLVRDPQGRVSEAKVFSILGKTAILFVLLQHTVDVLRDWTVLAVLVTALIAPDLFKKFLTLKAGGAALSADKDKA